MEQEQLWDYPVVLEGSPSTLASGKTSDQNVMLVGDTCDATVGQRWSRNSSYGITPVVLEGIPLPLSQGNFKLKKVLWETVCRTAIEQGQLWDCPVVLEGSPFSLAPGQLQAQKCCGRQWTLCYDEYSDEDNYDEANLFSVNEDNRMPYVHHKNGCVSISYLWILEGTLWRQKTALWLKSGQQDGPFHLYLSRPIVAAGWSRVGGCDVTCIRSIGGLPDRDGAGTAKGCPIVLEGSPSTLAPGQFQAQKVLWEALDGFPDGDLSDQQLGLPVVLRDLLPPVSKSHAHKKGCGRTGRQWSRKQLWDCPGSS
ncbi:hypothetical protein AVEN_255009-1 [Araneus ventricosus]|uniref:Uncharacterized protein n=1 Tax=Araneus ventricosus TaxID=182803 RepID=A0A4Y2TRC0_ARAVE|nr:hypothetical protein AVEN_255009-1 [Araneus ventricosus]